MPLEIPPQYLEEARLVEAEIRRVFAGVSREGGISWSGAEALDHHLGMEAAILAAEDDHDRSWEELVEDPDWWDTDTLPVGGFAFLDPIGFRYYLPAAMLRVLRLGGGDSLAYSLTLDLGEHLAATIGRDAWNRVNEGKLATWGILDRAQGRAAACFLRLMVASHAAVGDDLSRCMWADAYKSHWYKFDENPERLPGETGPLITPPPTADDPPV